MNKDQKIKELEMEIEEIRKDNRIKELEREIERLKDPLRQIETVLITNPYKPYYYPSQPPYNPFPSDYIIWC